MSASLQSKNLFTIFSEHASSVLFVPSDEKFDFFATGRFDEELGFQQCHIIGVNVVYSRDNVLFPNSGSIGVSALLNLASEKL